VDLYPWIVIGHVVAVILAFAAHGVAAFAMFRVRRERDRTRLAAILELSSASFVAAMVALLAAILLGIVAAVVGGHFAKFWPWASIIVLVLSIGSMTPLAAIPMNRVRMALGMAVQGDKRDAPPRVPGTDAELASALAGIRPELPTVIGVAAIAILVWLMRAKPF
jgi:F0F1-type ATP synthase assembly protein I